MTKSFAAADELSNDCADHGQGACDFQAAEKVRQCIRKPYFGKFLPPPRMQDAAEIEQFLFDRYSPVTIFTTIGKNETKSASSTFDVSP